MNVGVDANQNDTLYTIWSAFCVASGKREEDPLSVMWRAYRDGKSCTESREIWSSGVGEHIFIGQYADDQTSLDYLNARYYDGSRGQFLSEDQVLSDPQSLNTYSYSDDDPVTKSDPSGKAFDLDDAGGIVGGSFVGGVMYVGSSVLLHQQMTWGGSVPTPNCASGRRSSHISIAKRCGNRLPNSLRISRPRLLRSA
jgi:RHS repeat-associated protein